ncbi:c-type cytochrome [Benzoatithermus flavus]|uniref:C-type cytochrome n=1 Tax=Benzoatithermus flavus TaxID=3108223 RepID=A0ABU8XKF9_9PROT
MIHKLGACLLALGLAAPALAADPAKSLEEARIAAGEVMFRQNCMTCHSPDTAKNAFGPSLSGVIGRPAGSLPRFAYSDALKSSGLVWTEDNLRKWMADNEKLVPGTRMRHVSITDPAAQDFLIAYIKSL